MVQKQTHLTYTPVWVWWWLDYFLVTANFVSIVLLLISTLTAEAPLKRGFIRLGLVKYSRYYLTSLTIFSVQFLIVSLIQLILIPLFSTDATASVASVNDTLWRMQQAGLFLLISIPTRYIWTLMVCDDNPSAMSGTQRAESRAGSVDITAEDPTTVSKLRLSMSDDAMDQSDRRRRTQVSDVGIFTDFEEKASAYWLETWNPMPAEILELTRFYSLFARVIVHGISNVPKARPSLIIMNHALGHTADVPMMIHILRTYCEVTPRFLISPYHFNVPIWSDLLYQLGCAPRTRLSTEALMRSGQTIVLFGARREKRYVEVKHEKKTRQDKSPAMLAATGTMDDEKNEENGMNTDEEESDEEIEETFMVWDSQKDVFLDLAFKYNYLVVPTVCVSGDDVFNMIHNLPSSDYASSLINQRTRETIAQPFKRLSERKAFHLRFGDQIDIHESYSAVAASASGSGGGSSVAGHIGGSGSISITDHLGQVTIADTPRKRGPRLFGSDVEPISIGMAEMMRSTTPVPRTPSGVHRSGARRQMHERRWSRELKIQFRTAVEDAMSDSIMEMYEHIKGRPDPKALDAIQARLRKMTQGAEMLPSDLRAMFDDDDSEIETDESAAEDEKDEEKKSADASGASDTTSTVPLKGPSASSDSLQAERKKRRHQRSPSKGRWLE